YQHQDDLPRLPVPALEDTLAKYLVSVRPFLSNEEFAKTESLVKDFGKSGGDGEQLQAMLIERAEQFPNWLEEWWEYAAYLSDRTPNALYINMFSGFGSFQDFERPVSQARRAAETIRYTCEYLELLKEEKVRPETMGGRTLCMHMFSRLFASCRIPGSPVDYFERYDVDDVRHVLVLCEGRQFLLPVYDDDRCILTIGDLEAQLLHILKHSAYLNSLQTNYSVMQDDESRFIGALTSMGRDEWASARTELIEYDSYNKEVLEKVQSSLFALCLDNTTPENPSALARECAAGSCGNRWYDKSFQYIVFRNGMVGANMEHANVDATILMSMYRWLGERYLNRAGGIETFIESRHHTLEFLPPPELVRWKLSATIKAKIPAAIELFDSKGSAVRTVVVRNKKYGKEKLKKVRLFPDTFVQMGIQLTGFKLWGHVMPTYESGHSRMFYHGRTETIRTVTNEVKEWLDAIKRGEKDAVVFAKFEQAMARHKEISMAAVTGQGIDRHLLGLQIAAHLSGKSQHGLFTDVAYVKSGGGGNFVLSTSNVSGYPWLWGGFVPMVPHGIGVCYGIEKDFLGFIISSFDKNSHEREVPIPGSRFPAEKFQNLLFESFDDIYNMAEKHRSLQAKM
ncbi:TPA: hypothetical protein N0F65_010731, partial [Lagenidium giganteum]